jgi:hypothetical protein
MLFAIAEALRNTLGYVHHRALSDDLLAIHLHSDRDSDRPRCYIYTILWTAALRILFILPLTAPQGLQ